LEKTSRYGAGLQCWTLNVGSSVFAVKLAVTVLEFDVGYSAIAIKLSPRRRTAGQRPSSDVFQCVEIRADRACNEKLQQTRSSRGWPP